MLRNLCIAGIFCVSLLATGCCNFGQQQEAETLGSMSEVLKAVRTELRDSMPDGTAKDPAIGLQITKLQATFKVTKSKENASELKLSIVKPVGSFGGSTSVAYGLENTIVVEYGWPSETVYEVCPSSGKDSHSRPCKPDSKVPRGPDMSPR